MELTPEEGAHHAAIRNLYARYCFAIDDDDGRGLAACYSDDGVFIAVDGAVLKGRKEVERFVVETTGRRGRHHYLNVEIRCVTSRSAEARAYFLLVDTKTGAMTALGRTADSLVLEDDGEWRLKERRATFDWTSAAYQGALGLGAEQREGSPTNALP